MTKQKHVVEIDRKTDSSRHQSSWLVAVFSEETDKSAVPLSLNTELPSSSTGLSQSIDIFIFVKLKRFNTSAATVMLHKFWRLINLQNIQSVDKAVDNSVIPCFWRNNSTSFGLKPHTNKAFLSINSKKGPFELVSHEFYSHCPVLKAVTARYWVATIMEKLPIFGIGLYSKYRA